MNKISTNGIKTMIKLLTEDKVITKIITKMQVIINKNNISKINLNNNNKIIIVTMNWILTILIVAIYPKIKIIINLD